MSKFCIMKSSICQILSGGVYTLLGDEADE